MPNIFKIDLRSIPKLLLESSIRLVEVFIFFINQNYQTINQNYQTNNYSVLIQNITY
jgi:hypothetical protein